MDLIFYFLFWAAFIFLMMRFGCGAHIMGHEHNHTGQGNKDGESSAQSTRKWIAPEKDLDPVCQKKIRTENAKPSLHNGIVYFFCSRECREIFEAAPHLYVDTLDPEATNAHPQLEKNSG